MVNLKKVLKILISYLIAIIIIPIAIICNFLNDKNHLS